MKKIIILALFVLGLCDQVAAQETIITSNGDILSVWDVEIGSNSIFYKLKADDASSLKINKSDVLMIKYSNGRVERIDMSSENESTLRPASSTSSTTIESSAINSKLIDEFNSRNISYSGKDIGKKWSSIVALLGIKAGSVIETQEVKIDYIMKLYLEEHNLTGKTLKRSKIIDVNEEYEPEWDTKLYRLVAVLKNKTNRTLYIDLANSYLLLNGEAHPYYVPTAISQTTGTSSGVGVNMGAVTGAMGVGGSLGTLANGVNVSSGSANYNTTITYSQRIVSIPPMASITLDPQDIGQGMIYGVDGKMKWKSFNVVLQSTIPYLLSQNFVVQKKNIYVFQDLKRGTKIDIPEPTSESPLATYFTYSFSEDISNPSFVRTDLYVRQLVGLGKAKHVDYSQHPLAIPYIYNSSLRDEFCLFR